MSLIVTKEVLDPIKSRRQDLGQMKSCVCAVCTHTDIDWMYSGGNSVDSDTDCLIVKYSVME